MLSQPRKKQDVTGVEALLEPCPVSTTDGPASSSIPTGDSQDWDTWLCARVLDFRRGLTACGGRGQKLTGVP